MCEQCSSLIAEPSLTRWRSWLCETHRGGGRRRLLSTGDHKHLQVLSLKANAHTVCTLRKKEKRSPTFAYIMENFETFCQKFSPLHLRLSFNLYNAVLWTKKIQFRRKLREQKKTSMADFCLEQEKLLTNYITSSLYVNLC